MVLFNCRSSICCVAGWRAKDSAVSSKLDLMRHYFCHGYKYKEILATLLAIRGIKISVRQLKRLLKRMSVFRRGPESPIKTIISVILKDISGSGPCLGYKTMWKRLKDFYVLHVCRLTVLRLMWKASQASASSPILLSWS